MDLKTNEVAEKKVLKIFSKYGLSLMPKDLIETEATIETIEQRFASYDKEVCIKKRKYQILTYENMIHKDGDNKLNMVVLDMDGSRYICNY